MKKTTLCAASPGLAAAIALTLAGNAATAATITVNGSDDNPASTFCNLRSAIASINAGAATATCAALTSGDFADGDKIVFAPALAASTITLSQGRFTPTEPMTIQGSGQTIDAHGASSVFYALYPVLTLNDLTISNGNDANGSGAITVTGGTVTLNRVELVNNHGASGGAIGAFGGQLAKLRIRSSYLHGNTASGGGGAIFGQNAQLTLTDTVLTDNSAGAGGAVSSGGGFLKATDCSFSGNSADVGGAIATSNYTLLTRVTLSANTAGTTGGAIGVTGNGGPLLLVDSSVSGNSAATGGAIWFLQSGSVSVTNSTISGNTASGSGGAIYSKKYLQATLTSATIAGNTASSGGGIWAGPSGNYGTTALTAVNTILSGNMANSNPDVGGGSQALLSGNNDLFGTALNVAPLNTAGNQNVFTNAPGLGPVQDNGGPTPTCALLAGSLAINAGSNAAAAGMTTDQRGTGYARIINAVVDIGAYEYLGEDRLFLGDFEPPG